MKPVEKMNKRKIRDTLARYYQYPTNADAKLERLRDWLRMQRNYHPQIGK